MAENRILQESKNSKSHPWSTDRANEYYNPDLEGTKGDLAFMKFFFRRGIPNSTIDSKSHSVTVVLPEIQKENKECKWGDGPQPTLLAKGFDSPTGMVNFVAKNSFKPTIKILFYASHVADRTGGQQVPNVEINDLEWWFDLTNFLADSPEKALTEDQLSGDKVIVRKCMDLDEAKIVHDLKSFMRKQDGWPKACTYRAVHLVTYYDKIEMKGGKKNKLASIKHLVEKDPEPVKLVYPCSQTHQQLLDAIKDVIINIPSTKQTTTDKNGGKVTKNLYKRNFNYEFSAKGKEEKKEERKDI